jgi:hypothetical protein
MKQIIFLLLLSVTTVLGQTKPSWIENPQSKYPARDYLTAVGVGDTRKSAENNAAANLSLVFESSIKAENIIIERYKELFHGNTSTMEKESDVSKSAKVQSEQTLYNVQFVESFVDGEGRNYILAVLNRSTTADIYVKRIALNTEQILFYLERFKIASDTIQQFAYINAASVIARVNDSMMKQLIIIEPVAGGNVQLGYSYNDLMRQYSEAMKKVSFSLSIMNDPDGNVESAITAMLTEEGFVVHTHPLLSIEGAIAFKDIDLQRKEKFIRWSYQLFIRDRWGTTVITFSASGREGHVTREEAKARSIRTLVAKLKKAIPKQINAYIDSLVKR